MAKQSPEQPGELDRPAARGAGIATFAPEDGVPVTIVG